MSGLESAGFGLAGKAGALLLERWSRSSDFQRLCEALAERFEEETGFSAATFVDWGKDEAFMTVLCSYLLPPHEFDRGALIKAITPLVGPLADDSTAEDFAAEIADAIHSEMREAKEGDALVRFEMDRVLQATAVPGGGLSTDWAPQGARKHLGELIEQDPRGAGALQRALAGRDDLAAELELLVRQPQQWLKDGGAELWRTVAHLAEIVGCLSAAQGAWSAYEEKPGADRVRGLFGAADAAENAGDVEQAEALREQAREFDSEHELVKLLDALRHEDPGDRLKALEALPPTDNEERAAQRKAFLAMALIDLGRDKKGAELAEQALGTLPDDLRAREAVAASIVSANQRRWEAGHNVDRNALGTAVDHYRKILEILREARRHKEAGGVFGRLVYCELLAGRREAAATLLSEIPEEELLGEVPVELAGLALTAGDPQRVKTLMEAYEGNSAAGNLLRIQIQLRDPATRADGVSALDRGVADQNFEFAMMRLMAAVPSTGEVPWSDEAEEVVRKEKPVMASQLKAEWHERRNEPDAARRELAKHASEPRALRTLMMIYANSQGWKKAAPHAVALLELDPDLADRVAAGQVLRHAGEVDRAEGVLIEVFNHPEADSEERSAAFNELADIFMRSRRFEEARRLAAAEDAGIPSATWLAAHSLARLGETQEAFELADQLAPRNDLDRMLLSDLVFAHETPKRSLERLIGIADELPEPNESLEGQIVMALLRCDHEELDPTLVERAGPQQFVERFPESKLLWQESIPKEKDELLEKLRELTEGRAKAIALAEKRIFEDGDWPVGALAAAAGKGLAEIWAALGSLPISYLAGELRHAEVEAAQNAAGGPLLIDTAVLCVLELLPDDLVDAILAEYPHSEKTASTVDDLLNATIDPSPASDSEPAQILGWDLAEGRPVLQEVSAAEANVPKKRARRMLDLGRKFKTATEHYRADGEDLADSKVTTIYRDIIAIARSSGRCVYADDRFLRRILAAEGVETVGTLTLLDTLVDSGAISPDDRARGLAAMRARRALDLPSEGE